VHSKAMQDAQAERKVCGCGCCLRLACTVRRTDIVVLPRARVAGMGMMVLVAPQRLAALWGARQQRLADGAAQLAAAREELALIKVRARQALVMTGTEVHSMLNRAAHRTTTKKAAAA
jgi:hypothetical protein